MNTPKTIEEDTRSQPWKEWVEAELSARKKADETEEGRMAQEARVQAYINTNNEDKESEYESLGNKAG
ncbi:hypothetical protein F5B21DRAFT_479093 [Xylaria acuta]|nr:hypothetical protein F5B21DRAFT_479093 [Xylaria acuta]